MKYYIQFSYPYDFIMTEEYETMEELQNQIKVIKGFGMHIDAIFHGDRIEEEVAEWMDKNDR